MSSNLRDFQARLAIRCNAGYGVGIDDQPYWLCVRAHGHDGAHEASDGGRWVDTDKYAWLPNVWPDDQEKG